MGCAKTAKCCFLPILIIVLVIGAFILFSYFPVSDQRGFFGASRITEWPFLETGGLVLSVSDVKSERVGVRVCVEGVGKNISTTTLGYVRAFVVFLNSTGEAFDFSSGDVQSAGKIIRPEETFSFTRCTDDANREINEKDYKIFFEGKTGADYPNKKLLYTQ